MLRFKRHAGLAGLAAMAFAGLAASSGAWASNTLSATYCTVRGDPAFGTQCCGTYPDMVTGTLGPDEPATFALFGVGLAGVAFMKRRKPR